MPVTNQEIYDELIGVKDAVVGATVNVIHLPLWVKIVMGVSVVLLAALLITSFKRYSKNSDDQYLKEINQLDSTIKYQQRYIESLQAGQAERDSIIIRELGRISGNKATQTRIIKEYEKIAPTVNNLSRDELRREVTNF